MNQNWVSTRKLYILHHHKRSEKQATCNLSLERQPELNTNMNIKGKPPFPLKNLNLTFCVNFAMYRLNSVNPGLLPLSIFLLFSRDLHVVLTSEAPDPGSAELGDSLVWSPAPVLCCPMSPSTSAKFALSTGPLPFCHPSLSHSWVLWGAQKTAGCSLSCRVLGNVLVIHGGLLKAS